VSNKKYVWIFSNAGLNQAVFNTRQQAKRYAKKHFDYGLNEWLDYPGLSYVKGASGSIERFKLRGGTK
jgi:hypothetical protein